MAENIIQTILTCNIVDLVSKVAQAKQQINSLPSSSAKVDTGAAKSAADATTKVGEAAKESTTAAGVGLADVAAGFTNVRSAAMLLIKTLATGITVKWLIDINSQAENYRTQLEVMVKDTERAKAIIEEARAFSDKTPYTAGEVISATKQMMAAGMTDYNKYRQTASDWAAGMGVKLEETVHALARANSGQYGEAIERMRELGISTQDLWAQGLKFDNGGQFVGTTEQLMSAVNNIIQQRFGGMTERLSGEWDGLMSTLKSQWSQFAQALSQPIFDIAKSGLKVLVDEFKGSGNVREAFSSWWQALKDAFSGEGLNQLANSLGDALKSVWQAVKILISSFADLMAAATRMQDDFSFTNYTFKALAIAVDALGFGFKAIAALLAALGLGFRETGTAAKWLKDVMTFGWDEANKKFEESSKKNLETYQRQIDAINGVAKAKEEAGKKDQLSEEEKRKREQNAAYSAIQDAKSNVEAKNKEMSEKARIGKAIGANNVDMAQQEYQLAQDNLRNLERAEEQGRKVKLKEAQDAAMAASVAGASPEAKAEAERKLNEATKESAQLTEARTVVMERAAAVVKAQVEQYDALGQYVMKYQKIQAEANAITSLGGDATVKRYEAMKQAIQDYLQELDQVGKAQIEAAHSSASLKNLLAGFDQGSVKGMVEVWKGAQKQILSFGDTVTNSSLMSVQEMENREKGLVSAEKVANVERLSDRLSVIREMLSSEQLGAQQRLDLIKQERSTYSELNRSIVDGVKNAEAQIEALQSKAIGAGSQALSLLNKYYSRGEAIQGAQTLASAVTSIWRTTGTHSLEQISQYLAFQDMAKKNGAWSMPDISYHEIITAAKNAMGGVKDTIQQLQENMRTLLTSAADARQERSSAVFRRMVWLY